MYLIFIGSVITSVAAGFILGACYYKTAIREDLAPTTALVHRQIEDVRNDPEVESMTVDDWIAVLHEVVDAIIIPG